jgi:NAD(P)-dependent dehydrogenase (short-subunit alcohol dehydrogenase family)
VKQLAGRVAVVTGAASGIGLALTEAFVAEGMRVLMADVDELRLRTEEHRLYDGGADVAAAATDVADPEAVLALGEEVVDRFGALHVAVNNAGIVRGGRSWELPLEDWQKVLSINLWGVIHGIRAFVPRILATGEEGHVVNTASMAAVIARPGIGAYTVSKHGVLGLSDVLRAELAEAGVPVGVSVVMPGMIKTGMNPIGSVSSETVARNVVDAIRRDRPYVFTDDHSADDVQTRLHAILAARSDVLPA